MSTPHGHSESVPDDASSATSPGTTPTHTSFPGRMPYPRSVSQASHWSATETPQHHHQGTSYFSSGRPTSPTARRGTNRLSRAVSSASVRRPRNRSTSVTSSGAPARSYRDEGGLLSEEEEDEMDSEEPRRPGEASDPEHDDENDTDREEDPITVKERQSLINVEHPFGLPIWKPALYKKSRSVTRYADQALHSVPSAQAERHLLPGNIFWVIAFGWWLSLTCFTISAVLFLIPFGGRQYSTLVFGLGWYIAWPFGKYVEGDLSNSSPVDEEIANGENGAPNGNNSAETTSATDGTSRPPGVPLDAHSTITPRTIQHHASSISWDPTTPGESTALLGRPSLTPAKSYGTAPSPSYSSSGFSKKPSSVILGKALYWIFFALIIAPLIFLVCIICWGLVFTVPMAKLTWTLIKYMFEHPDHIRFCAAPVVAVPLNQAAQEAASAAAAEEGDGHDAPPIPVSFKHARLSAGQAAPSGAPKSTVLLCTYRAFGWKYYKYTVGGVNIMFVNLLPIVFFVILDGMVVLPIVDEWKNAGKHVPGILLILTARPLIFVMSLASVIPLSYFIGMAVASISAQSSIGMGAVINASFGSIIEIILYAIALTEQKGHLVEGSIVGSLLAGVLLMPGVSMCSGAIRRKEQKFNAKSAGVTSMLLIMAFIGTLAPTLFYQTYGSFQLVCDGCPSQPSLDPREKKPWVCQHCYYEHPDPVDDPFYQSTVKSLMYFCAGILLISYLVGLWFSLRTHASQIWQNPQQLMHPMEMSLDGAGNRISLYQRLIPSTLQKNATLQHKPSIITTTASTSREGSRSQTPVPRAYEPTAGTSAQPQAFSPTQSQTLPQDGRRVSYATQPSVQQPGYTPLLESVDHAIKDSGIQPLQLPGNMTPDDFTRAVAVATVSALRHQQRHAHSPGRIRTSGAELEAGAHGGHEGPSWSRTTSASVLLACTALYAAIAELLIKVVDVVLEGSGIDEKFLGITLFALVPNTTEFMNAISFAMNGNIALSMEIGSAYALQVCLLQIPAMVAFSAWYAPDKMGSVAETFTLIFPRWDVIVIILSVFLLTYTYIEAKSNYHRGSILILSYLVLTSGFYFAPQRSEDDTFVGSSFVSLSLYQSAKAFLSL